MALRHADRNGPSVSRDAVPSMGRIKAVPPGVKKVRDGCGQGAGRGWIRSSPVLWKRENRCMVLAAVLFWRMWEFLTGKHGLGPFKFRAEG